MLRSLHCSSWINPSKLTKAFIDSGRSSEFSKFFFCSSSGSSSSSGSDKLTKNSRIRRRSRKMENDDSKGGTGEKKGGGDEEEELGPTPEKPLPGDCCGSGCERCVWDIYFDELDEYNKRKKELEESKEKKSS